MLDFHGISLTPRRATSSVALLVLLTGLASCTSSTPSAAKRDPGCPGITAAYEAWNHETRDSFVLSQAKDADNKLKTALSAWPSEPAKALAIALSRLELDAVLADPAQLGTPPGPTDVAKFRQDIEAIHAAYADFKMAQCS